MLTDVQTTLLGTPLVSLKDMSPSLQMSIVCLTSDSYSLQIRSSEPNSATCEHKLKTSFRAEWCMQSYPRFLAFIGTGTADVCVCMYVCTYVRMYVCKCCDSIVVRVLGWDLKVPGSIPADVNYTGYASLQSLWGRAFASGATTTCT